MEAKAEPHGMEQPADSKLRLSIRGADPCHQCAALWIDFQLALFPFCRRTASILLTHVKKIGRIDAGQPR